MRPHVKCRTQARASVSVHGDWSVVLRFEIIQKRVTKIIKGVKNHSYKERSEKLGLTTLLERKTRCDLIEISKIINGISFRSRNL